MPLLRLNKKGQVGDIFEFKIALMILLIVGALGVIMLSFSAFGEEPIFRTFDDRSEYLNDRILFQELLIDSLKKDDLSDKIVKGEEIEGFRIIHPNNYDDPEDFEIFYDMYLGEIKEEVLVDEVFNVYFLNAKTHVMLPTFDGEHIIGVVMEDG